MSGKQSIVTTHWDDVARDFVAGRDGGDAAYRAALVAIAQHVRVWIGRHMGERLHGTSAVETLCRSV